MSRAAAWVAFAISAIYAAQGLFLLCIGYDPSRLVQRTGVDWDEFVSAYPAVAEDLALKHNERLFSVTLLALALLATVVIYRGIRRGIRAWEPVIWTLPVAMFGMAAVLLLAGISDLGFGTLVSAGVLTAATWLARPMLIDAAALKRPSEHVTGLLAHSRSAWQPWRSSCSQPGWPSRCPQVTLALVTPCNQRRSRTKPHISETARYRHLCGR